MTKKRYEELIADETVVKVGTIGGGYFKDKFRVIAIQFFFYHPGAFFQSSLQFNSRIELSVFPLENLIKEIDPITILESVIIMANADSSNYALTYRLTVNYKDKIVTLNLEDGPELGERLLSSQEKNGIVCKYQ